MLQDWLSEGNYIHPFCSFKHIILHKNFHLWKNKQTKGWGILTNFLLDVNRHKHLCYTNRCLPRASLEILTGWQVDWSFFSAMLWMGTNCLISFLCSSVKMQGTFLVVHLCYGKNSSILQSQVTLTFCSLGVFVCFLPTYIEHFLGKREEICSPPRRSHLFLR